MIFFLIFATKSKNMFTFNRLITNICLFAGLLFIANSCKETDEFFSSKEDKTVTEEINSFDFSTIRSVDLIVDYSAFNTYGPVRFSIYARDPFVKGIEENPYWIDESIDPLFTDYTDAYGKYDATVTLPAYAKLLYIVTGDLYVSQKRMLAEVVNGVAKAVAEKPLPSASSRNITRAPVASAATNDMSKFYNLSYKIDVKGANTGVRVYKDWLTPLGTWDAASGRPNYLLERTAANMAKGLVFDDADLTGLYNAAKAALKSTSSAGAELLSQADMTLQKESEVSITMIGGNTCWCSTLGYYYYTDATKPKKTTDMNIIMLFPNTMNEYYADKPSCDFQGNIGVHNGDAVQLMYYPNIAKGDLSGATTKFPAGTKIGFIMKTNGWGSQGSGYGLKQGVGGIGWDCERKYNTWPTSTDGLSYCDATGMSGIGNYLNPTGASRTAKFGYTAKDGTEYAIVSFEDANNDLNYSDVIFTLNPANAFTTLAEVGDNKTSTVGVFAFEDMWPERGDYDMNDVVVNVKTEMYFNNNGKVTKQAFLMTTYQKNVDFVNGLASRLTNLPSNATITMKRIAPGVTDVSKAVTANFTRYDDTTGRVYYLTDKVESELGSTYIIEVKYASAIDATKTADVEPFIYRAEDNNKFWEVHIPYAKPTSRMNTSYFGTANDRSNPSKGEYFVRQGLYPFAFYLSGTKAEAFFDTILNKGGEINTIDVFYPTFLGWSSSKGSKNEDWYLNPKGK